MKLLFIRHGAPDYIKDCLTEKGTAQAERLAERLKDEHITAAYMSPMGRAKETALICLDGTGIPLTECAWLHEFDVSVHGLNGDILPWDLEPECRRDGRIFDREGFDLSDTARGTDMKARYLAVSEGLDSVLAAHGLIKDGDMYVKQGVCGDTLAFFCHFGATCVMIAKLLGISPVLTLQGMSCEPTAIAVMCTDDRFGNRVNFRLHSYGDINHLEDRQESGINYK